MNNNTAINSKEISMVHKLINESIMSGLLEKYCIDDVSGMKLIEAYECDNEHVGLIVEAKNKDTNDKERIIIDAVVGYPVTDQVFNTLYKKGSDCDKRFIIYTKGSAEFDTFGGEDDDIVKNLIKNLNRYGTNIFLVKMESNFHEGRITYRLITRPPKFVHYKLSDLPSEAKLREQEFWEVYYLTQFQDFIYPWTTFIDLPLEQKEFGEMSLSDGAEFYAKWTEEGIFFEAKDETEKSECLEPIWNTRKYDIQALFPDAEVTFFTKPGKLPKLLIKFLPTSVKFLLDASISEKENLANEIFKEFHNFMEFMEFALDDIDNGKIDEAKEAEQLAQTE